jgi:hypothetical protein
MTRLLLRRGRSARNQRVRCEIFVSPRHHPLIRGNAIGGRGRAVVTPYFNLIRRDRRKLAAPPASWAVMRGRLQRRLALFCKCHELSAWGGVDATKGSKQMPMKFASAAAAAVLAAVVSFNAQALPVAAFQSGQAEPLVTLVAGGCGPGFHRGPYGHCRANREAVVVVPGAPVVVEPVAPVVVAPVACPPGFHLGPRGRACHPN